MIAGTKFQPKLVILIFWAQFAQKGYFQSESEKSHLRTMAKRHNDILMSLLLLVADTIKFIRCIVLETTVIQREMVWKQGYSPHWCHVPAFTSIQTVEQGTNGKNISKWQDICIFITPVYLSQAVQNAWWKLSKFRLQ